MNIEKVKEGTAEIFSADEKEEFMRVDLDGSVRWWQSYNGTSYVYVDSPEFEQLEEEYEERFESDQKILYERFPM